MNLSSIKLVTLLHAVVPAVFVRSHATQIRYCMTGDTNTRIFFETTHDPRYGCGSINIRDNVAGTISESIPNGYFTNESPSRLFQYGCRTSYTNVSSFARSYDGDWCYFDIPVTHNLCVNYTILSAGSTVLWDYRPDYGGGRRLYPAEVVDNIHCDSSTDSPTQTSVPSTNLPLRLAGYITRSEDVTESLERDLIVKELEDLIGDGSCASFDLAGDFYEGNLGSGDGDYFSTIPTYGLGPGESLATVTKEYTKYYGTDDFVDVWARKAIAKKRTTFRRGNANFEGAFPSNHTGFGGCVGFEEALSKGLAYTGAIYELSQQCQKAIDAAKGGCRFQQNGCTDAIDAWDSAVAVYVGSVQGEEGGNLTASNVTLYSLANANCYDYWNCARGKSVGTVPAVTSPVNINILGIFSAGSHAAYAGDHNLMEEYLRLISNKIAIPLLHGLYRNYYRLSEEESGPGKFSTSDQVVGAGGAFAFGVLPKLWACSTRGERKAAGQTKIGGGVAGVRAVDFQVIRLAFECNYQCLGITCGEIGSLADGVGGSLPGMEACDSNENGCYTCANPSKTRKSACKQFAGKPGIRGRGRLVFESLM